MADELTRIAGPVATPSTAEKTVQEVTLDEGHAFGKEESPRSSKKRGRSAAWEYCTVTTNATAKCSLCNEAVKHSGNTSNLFKVKQNQSFTNRSGFSPLAFESKAS